MKRILASTALAACFALPAMAQSTNSPFLATATGPSVSAEDLIGSRIYASEAALDKDTFAGIQTGWNDIGEIDDVILTRDGKVDAVMLDIGGFLGIGEKRVAVAMNALKFVQDSDTDADDYHLVVQADRTTLEGAPVWGTAAADAEMKAEATTTADANTVATAETASTLPEGYVAADPTVVTSEALTGAKVHDATNASVAEIQDLVVDPAGKVTDVVLDVGGFLGIGAKTVSIPMDRLTVGQYTDGKLALWVNMTKEELEALPKYEG
jgi:Zn finger protein HypA/HybF involved in hydrogenase expression